MHHGITNVGVHVQAHMKQTKRNTIIVGLVLYLLSSGVSYATFSFLGVGESSVVVMPDTVVSADDSGIDPSLPRTEPCPLNGKLYTEIERDIWEARRPLTVMIENSTEARPHSGVIKADIVYEAVAEGGVTRFMGVFLCGAAAKDVVLAPVRSVRTYFLDWASEYGETPLFAHVGGANCSAPEGTGRCLTDKRAQAIEQLSQYGWRYQKGNDLDQFAIGAPTYIRSRERLGRTVALEHSMVSSTELLWKVGEKRGWTHLDPDGVEWTDSFEPWTFKDELPEAERGAVRSVSHDFWEGYKAYDVRWEYDVASNVYKRFNGGEPHKDLETGDQLAAKNVVVMLTKETGPVDDLKHMLYKTEGEGQALIFMDGEVVDGFWSKTSRLARTEFTTKKGEAIAFNPGQIWISVVSDDTDVAY